MAKFLCIVVAGSAGWTVLVNLAEIHEGWIPPSAGATTMLIVLLLLYFPLARPVADAISDKLSTATHRGKHIRTGSGISDLPQSIIPRAPKCNICGSPNGPICPTCDEKMKQI